MPGSARRLRWSRGRYSKSAWPLRRLRAQGSISAEPERTPWERERHEEELRARKFDWAFLPENARNPEAKRIRVDAYLRNGQMISPYIPMVRQDIQEAFVMLAGPLGEVGAPVLLVSGGVHAYYGEYAEALMDVAPVAAGSILKVIPRPIDPVKVIQSECRYCNETRGERSKGANSKHADAIWLAKRIFILSDSTYA